MAKITQTFGLSCLLLVLEILNNCVLKLLLNTPSFRRQEQNLQERVNHMLILRVLCEVIEWILRISLVLVWYDQHSDIYWIKVVSCETGEIMHQTLEF